MMALRESYEESVTIIVERIAHQVPYDLAEQFATHSGLTAASLHPVREKTPGLVTAIDGSNAVVAESGSFALAAIRAGKTTFDCGERKTRSTTPLTVVSVGPDEYSEDFALLMRDCFGAAPQKALENNDAERVSAILRDTLEYWIALKEVQELPRGSLLLLDGALRVTDTNHEPVLEKIITTAQDRGVLLAAVTKRTRATWGGGHPLLPAVAGLAERARIKSPWWVRIDETILDSEVYRRGRKGDTYVASFHPKKQFPLKLELPEGTADQTVESIMRAITACCDDGRIPGYPYPLLDAHRTVVIDRVQIEQIRQDLMRGFTKKELNHEMYDLLFGDIHDDFRRY
jgi:hypothetical protein